MITITEKQQKHVTDTKSKPFGITPTDHMFLAEYKNGEWSNSRIVPFEDLSISPIAQYLHQMLPHVCLVPARLLSHGG